LERPNSAFQEDRLVPRMVPLALDRYRLSGPVFELQRFLVFLCRDGIFEKHMFQSTWPRWLTQVLALGNLQKPRNANT